MTKQEQRAAIAKVMGWTVTEKGWWKHVNHDYVTNPPDYPNDLNAMREVVMSLTYDQQAHYLKHLFHVLIKLNGDAGVTGFDIHIADPKYCAESFLKTLNLWTE